MSPSLPLLETSTARSGPIAIASHASAPAATVIDGVKTEETCRFENH